MSNKKLRVFHGLVNYGTQAGLFAKGLRELGVDAKSFTHNDPFNRPTDYQFTQPKGLIGKLFYYKFWYPIIKFSCFFRFDIFHFYFGTTLNAKQWDLPLYKLFGKKVVMHYLGNDIELYQWSLNNYAITNMQFLFTQEQGAQHDKKVIKRRNFEKKYIDKELVCAPQYAPFIPGVKVLPLALDISSYSAEVPLKYEKGDILRLLHAPTSRKKKGTQFLLDAVEKLKEEGYLIRLELCEGIPYSELMKKYKDCHISVNALLGGWYGTVGIEAMAVGRPLISFIRPNFLEIMGLSQDELPIISANKDNIYEKLKEILEGKYNLIEMTKQSRIYVEKHHDLKKNSQELLEIYKKL